MALYDVDLTYDRNSNITVLDEHVHDGFDVEYTYDDLNRLTKASEGTWNGSSITSKTREQEWTLSQTGNWDVTKLDLNGDGDYVDTDEHNDDRTYNAVNELTGRDTDDNGTDDHTLNFDAAGNLTDDDEDYEYEYDAFYRLRKIKDQSQALILENTYNGLGHRNSAHFDSDDDGDVDGSDDWEHYAYDERWREVAMFLNSETAPTTEHLNHAAGQQGYGGSSYIDRVVLRDRDTSGSGFDERLFYLQNRHHDVVCLIRDDDSDEQVEMVRYSAYGVPFGLPAGDVDSDGDCDGASEIQGLGGYDVRGDLDLDGDVDSTDEGLSVAATFGREKLSGAENRYGYGGYALSLSTSWGTRNRAMLSEYGCWAKRDRLGYIDGIGLYEYVGSSPIVALDPQGEFAVVVDGEGGGGASGGVQGCKMKLFLFSGQGGRNSCETHTAPEQSSLAGDNGDVNVDVDNIMICCKKEDWICKFYRIRDWHSWRAYCDTPTAFCKPQLFVWTWPHFFQHWRRAESESTLSEEELDRKEKGWGCEEG